MTDTKNKKSAALDMEDDPDIDTSSAAKKIKDTQKGQTVSGLFGGSSGIFNSVA